MRRTTKKFIDIGANLLDGMYQGNYHGNNKHVPDLDAVLKRAWSNGLTHIIVTAGNLKGLLLSWSNSLVIIITNLNTV